MSSLIREMRPGQRDLEKRRWGPRTYDPSYNLYQHIDVDRNAHTWLDPKPVRAPPVAEQQMDGSRVWRTRHGSLDGERLERFADPYRWTSETHRAFGSGLPLLKAMKHPPRGECKLHPSTNPSKPGPQDWQRVFTRPDGRNHGLLPEAKFWQGVAQDYKAFPNNVGPRSPLTWERRPEPGRTAEQERQLQSYIRGLVRNDKLMPQYERRLIGQTTMNQKEVRLTEPLERPPGRNPPGPWSTSVTIHDHRPFDLSEYRAPQFGIKAPQVNTIVTSYPFNSHNQVSPFYERNPPVNTGHHPRAATNNRVWRMEEAEGYQ